MTPAERVRKSVNWCMLNKAKARYAFNMSKIEIFHFPFLLMQMLYLALKTSSCISHFIYLPENTYLAHI